MVLALFLPLGKLALTTLQPMHSVGALQQFDCSAMASNHGAAAMLTFLMRAKAR
jgi:hypothetical protein